jgi:hypothetical protein
MQLATGQPDSLLQCRKNRRASGTALSLLLGAEGEDFAGIDLAAKVRIPSPTNMHRPPRRDHVVD